MKKHLRAIKKVEKRTHVKIIMISRTCFIFMIFFMVFEEKAYIDVCYGDTYPEKND